jgi:hypothetical protein
MSFTRRLKYSNIVMKRNIKQNVSTVAVGMSAARAETWTFLGFSLFAMYIMGLALSGM